jgi:thioredoxin reductase (NADPH)
MDKIEDVIIIGGGPAGYSAAIYTAREDFEPLVISGITAGGQLMLTNEVENYPAFPTGVMGPDLMDLFRKQAENFGARFINDNVTKIDVTSRPFKVNVGDKEYLANSLIIATGASAKWLNIPSEQKFIGKGVSSCATCDAPFFKNKDVIAVGGGDTAMEESLFLTKFAKSVTLIHRRDKFRASKIMQERVWANPKIKVILNSIIEEVLGEEKVSGVKIKDLTTHEITELKTDGLFVAIGHSPNTAFLKGVMQMDEHGYLITQEEVKTNIDGIFVAGDVADKDYRQAVTAAGSGAKAAIEARSYLQNLKYLDSP